MQDILAMRVPEETHVKVWPAPAPSPAAATAAAANALAGALAGRRVMHSMQGCAPLAGVCSAPADMPLPRLPYGLPTAKRGTAGGVHDWCSNYPNTMLSEAACRCRFAAPSKAVTVVATLRWTGSALMARQQVRLLNKLGIAGALWLHRTRYVRRQWAQGRRCGKLDTRIAACHQAQAKPPLLLLQGYDT